MNREMKIALISFAGAILAAIIGGLFLLYTSSTSTHPQDTPTPTPHATAAQTLSEFCLLIQAHGLDPAYMLYSDNLKSKVSPTQFNATWSKTLSNCTTTITNSSDTNPMGTIATTEFPSSQNTSYNVTLVKDNKGFWRINSIAATSGSRTNTSTATTAPSSSPTTSTTPTPIVTPTTGETVPSAAQIDPAAAAIITKAQTASAIDSNDFPTTLTSNFTVGQTVYVTFNLTLNGQSGYVEAKFYGGTTYIGNKILMVQSAFDHGYFTFTFNRATTGNAEMYWCTKSDCSDAKLATLVTFNLA